MKERPALRRPLQIAIHSPMMAAVMVVVASTGSDVKVHARSVAVVAPVVSVVAILPISTMDLLDRVIFCCSS